jgi:hypothetical protein
MIMFDSKDDLLLMMCSGMLSLLADIHNSQSFNRTFQDLRQLHPRPTTDIQYTIFWV